MKSLLDFLYRIEKRLGSIIVFVLGNARANAELNFVQVVLLSSVDAPILAAGCCVNWLTPLGRPHQCQRHYSEGAAPATNPLGRIDYRCADGRFLMSPRGVAVSNARYLSSNETMVYAGIRGWKLHLSESILCPESAGGFCFTKKLNSSFSITAPDIFQHLLKCSIFKCIYWLNGSFFWG